jgi:hypothetical protein
MKALLGILIVTVWVSPLIAQDTTRVIVDSALTPAIQHYRDPRLALVLGSLIPGAGHIYAGEYLRGAQNYAGTLSVIGMGALIFSLDNCGLAFLSDCKPRSNIANRIVGGAGIGIGVLTWISSARDAARAAERTNERLRRTAAYPKPIIETPAGPHGEWRAGVALPW